ncbi:MAG: hypothetical protein HWD59_09760 [Coxiellaceae bacterium]|nr:MAG: hypothetical protein HWD59_09760 [Coxiellaceae bacterium]
MSHRIKADEPIFNDPPPPDLQDYLPILKPGKALVLQSNDLDCLTESIKTNYKPSLIVSIDENTSQIDLIDRLLQSAKTRKNCYNLTTKQTVSGKP